MLLFFTLAFADDKVAATCNTASDRADTACWLDTWEKPGYTIELGIKSGKKWLEIKHDGDTLQEGKLEGRSRRSATMNGCAASLAFEKDGKLAVKLDGPECPVEAVGSYTRKGNTELKVPSHCGRQTYFSCETTGESVLSVCRDKGMNLTKNVDLDLVTLVYGDLGSGTQTTYGTVEKADGEISWNFGEAEGEMRSVTAVDRPDEKGAQMAEFLGGRLLGTVTCKPGYHVAP